MVMRKLLAIIAALMSGGAILAFGNIIHSAEAALSQN
jgi:hypothetical protein